MYENVPDKKTAHNTDSLVTYLVTSNNSYFFLSSVVIPDPELFSGFGSGIFCLGSVSDKIKQINNLNVV